MVDFELSPDLAATRAQLHMLAEHAMRPIAREYDEREHEKPWDFINMMWQLSKSSGIGPGASKESKDRAAIQATAVRDGDQWVLNGTKIFCTSGLMAGDATKSNGFVVVWATVDRSAGRAGIKSFIVDAGTPGMTVAKCEDKLGIRASDTATLIF